MSKTSAILVLAGGLVLGATSAAEAQFGISIGNSWRGRGVYIGNPGYSYGNPGYSYGYPSYSYGSQGYSYGSP